MPFNAEDSDRGIGKRGSEPVGDVAVFENTEAPKVCINVLRAPDEPF